jgi:malonyl-CoA O-methyltransferase
MLAEPRKDPQGAGLDGAALARTAARLYAAPRAPWLHEEAARRMAERLPLVRRQPDLLLDWSGPLGGSAELLKTAYPKAQRHTIGIADAPVAAPAARAPRRWPWPARKSGAPLLAEGEVPAGAAQLVWSNMLLQAIADPRPLLARWHEALAVDGFLMFATLGPGSLPELRAIYRAERWGEPMQAFVDMHDLGDMLVFAGFADPVMDQEILTLTWPDVPALLAELRALGANLSPRRHQGLRTPRWRERLQQALATTAQDGRPRLSFELVYGHAFKAAPRAPVQLSKRKPDAR